MTGRVSSRVMITFVVAVTSLLLGAMTAWACTNLATLNLSQSAVQAGNTIEVTGSSFKAPAEGVQPVQLHWNSAAGPILAEAVPDAAGSILTQVTIPADAQPGHYVLVATQMAVDPGHGLPSGEPVFGTPARAAVMVGSPAPVEGEAAGAPTVSTTPEPGSGAMVAVTALLALLGLGLFGGGLALFVREVRSRRVTARVQSTDA
ncbi:MAG: hypothetical protein M3O70_12405 [Actinomycetota bacterium]|nr:hypothetical protein [Actinomycetota bacterium]